MDVFESNLPAGGSNYKGNKTTDYCILDCVYDQTTFTFYVLDMMCWKGHPIYDCDTEFRLVYLIHIFFNNNFLMIIVTIIIMIIIVKIDFIGSLQNLMKLTLQLQLHH